MLPKYDYFREFLKSAEDQPRSEDYAKGVATIGGAAGSGALMTRFLPVSSDFAKRHPVLRGALYAGGLSTGGLATRAGVDAIRGLPKSLQNESSPQDKIASDMPPFLEQNRPAKVKEIYKALRRDHPEYPAEKKARIASSMAKSAAILSGQDPSGVGLGVALHDDARAYGIRAGKGGTDDRGLAYSQGMLAAGGAGVLGGAGAASITGSPFLTSTLLNENKRNAAINQFLKDSLTLKAEGLRLGRDQAIDLARRGVDLASQIEKAAPESDSFGRKATSAGLDAVKNVLTPEAAPSVGTAGEALPPKAVVGPTATSLSPEALDIFKRRGKAAAKGALVGFGAAALGKGLYNAAEYSLAKNLANPENAQKGAVKRASLLDKIAEIEYRGRTFPGYNQPIDSDRPEKKKMVLAKKGDQVKLIHFGQKGYKHNYSDAAKKNYLTRSAGIRGKDGSLTANDKLSANYWARRELWPKNEPADGSAKNRTSGKQLEKKAGRPILQYRGQVTNPRWWYLNKKGNPASKTWLKKQRGEAVALGESVADARGDYGRPFGRTESHLHGAKGSEGIHFYGTLSDARNALKSAKRGNSTLKEASFKIASSDEDLGHGMELAGLGILGAPAATHLGAKVPGVRKAAKPLSDYLKKNHSIEDAVELGGLGVLGVPAIKHFMDRKSKKE
jgi:hypothetical protein